MRKIAVIDPGHGGNDPGAVNVQLNCKEKDIVLNVALYLKEELRSARPDIVPFMSRETDKSVSLKIRCDLANYIIQDDFFKPAIQADAFLSIHTNARFQKGKYGLEIETYYHKGSKVGKHFAEIVQKGLVAQTNTVPVIDRGVKIGERWSEKQQQMVPFYVLKHTKMPAALVELGFISDVEECIILSSPRHQKAMAKILANSLCEFLD